MEGKQNVSEIKMVNSMKDNELTIDTISKLRTKKIILFGASSRGIRCLNNLLGFGFDKSKITFFDNDESKWNKKLENIKIISYKQLLKYNKNTPIIISSSMFGEIQTQLKNLKFKNVHYFHTLLFPKWKFEKYDKKFENLYSLVKNKCYMDSEEQFSIYSSIKSVSNIEGDIAEVGVYKGGSAKLICEIKNQKHFHLFDTFEGLPKTEKDDLVKAGWLDDTSLNSVQNYLKKYDKIHVY